MRLGVDVGGSKILAALVDQQGGISQRHREALDQSTESSVIEQLVRILSQFLPERPESIGIGVPGIADRKRQTVWAPNVRGWDHIALKRGLEDRLGREVVVESDRGTAVLGEMLYGAARDQKDVVYLILGTGIGAGIVSDGRLVRGANDIGGAVGWVPVLFDGQLRHFESVAAGPGMESLAREAGLPAPLPRVAELARSGRKEARELFWRVGEVVGQALAILVSTLNPKLIIMGGGVSNAWDLMEEAARSSFWKWSQPIARETVAIVRSRLGDDAGILGAAAAAYYHEKN